MKKRMLSLFLALCLGLSPWLTVPARAVGPEPCGSHVPLKSGTAVVIEPSPFTPAIVLPNGFGFVDVPEAQYYYVPVAWAVARGITDGTTPTTFSPDQVCTQGQVLTFLWRSVGSPEPDLPAVNPFPLASEDAYYYKPLLWALSIGALYDSLDFEFDQVDPNAPCTRLTAIFYMWNAMGYIPENLDHPFTDVGFSVYTPAVAWALDACVTDGTTPTTFSPDQICTRGQIVTFLYRALYLSE